MAAAAAPVNEVLMSLPPANRRVLLHVIELLRDIDPQSTKMTPDNLAICFSPCFFRCADMMQVRVHSLVGQREPTDCIGSSSTLMR